MNAAVQSLLSRAQAAVSEAERLTIDVRTFQEDLGQHLLGPGEAGLCFNSPPSARSHVANDTLYDYDARSSVVGRDLPLTGRSDEQALTPSGEPCSLISVATEHLATLQLQQEVTLQQLLSLRVQQLSLRRQQLSALHGLLHSHASALAAASAAGRAVRPMSLIASNRHGREAVAARCQTHRRVLIHLVRFARRRSAV
jgi:hypothetical protein